MHDLFHLLLYKYRNGYGPIAGCWYTSTVSFIRRVFNDRDYVELWAYSKRPRAQK